MGTAQLAFALLLLQGLCLPAEGEQAHVVVWTAVNWVQCCREICSLILSTLFEVSPCLERRAAQVGSGLQAEGRELECINLYKGMENTHPVPTIRRQAANLRFILEAPKLKIGEDERVKLPVLTSASRFVYASPHATFLGFLFPGFPASSAARAFLCWHSVCCCHHNCMLCKKRIKLSGHCC